MQPDLQIWFIECKKCGTWDKQEGSKKEVKRFWRKQGWRICCFCKPLCPDCAKRQEVVNEANV